MQFKRYDLAIINLSFWPKNQIIGDALLQLGEKASDKGKCVVVITQYVGDLKKIADKFGRGSGLLFRSCKSRSDSSTKLLFRIVDAVIYMLWVFWSLLATRPKKIYVSTDPPLIVPFVVFIYSKIFKASYVYHLQDIHPEAANIAVKLNPVLFSFLRKIDGLVMRHASGIITITQTMKHEIISRSKTKSRISLVDNPTVVTCDFAKDKIKGFVFSGNAGRVQRIPLLLKSIREYKNQGGTLPFLFIGAGVHSNAIRLLSKEYDDVTYEGLVGADIANELTAKYEWALLPIEDEVTRYAFPSKTSSYALCGTNILSICSDWTPVAKWVVSHNYGINTSPDIDNIVKAFFKIESGVAIDPRKVDADYFSIERFAENIYGVIYGKVDGVI